MKIAVFGWYGHNNAGDERIKYCLNHFLMQRDDIEIVDFFDLHESAIGGKTNKYDHYDLVIIGGGGLILSHHNYHDFILGINTKIVTLGISVETKLSRNPKKFSCALLEKSFAVLVRDKSSKEKLSIYDKRGIVKVSPDLTFLKPYDVEPVAKGDCIGINLFSRKKTDLYSFMQKYLPSRLVNKLMMILPPQTICFKKMLATLKIKYPLIPIPLYCQKQNDPVLDHQKNDILFMKKYFSEVPNNFTDTLVESSKIFMSMRLHGLIFAVQKGVIPFTFSSYPKQVNFMKEVGLGNLVFNFDELEKVENSIHQELKVLEITRAKVLIYRDKSEQKIKTDIENIIKKIKE